VVLTGAVVVFPAATVFLPVVAAPAVALVPVVTGLATGSSFFTAASSAPCFW
jgi:hypothetical protein